MTTQGEMPNCWKCGSDNVWWGRDVQRGTDIMRFGVCQSCWEVQDTVNREHVRIVFFPKELKG